MAVKKWIFDLNIMQKSRIPRMELVQGDTDANVFQIHLKTMDRQTEKPVDLSDSYVTVTIKKADGTVVVGTADIIDSVNGVIEYTCRGNELSCPGLALATVEVYDAARTKRFTTTQFKFYVVEQLDDGSGIPSTTEYTVLTDLIAQTQSVVTNENERIENENERIENENARIANENIRQENELIRQNNEQARVIAENNRVNAESIREANENERIKNENIRQANEEARNTAEANREQAERLRQMAEQERINAENARVAAENARNEAELARENAESIRQSNESARISEENTRILQENARVQAEDERIANENIREDNEAVRQDNESVRILQENARVKAENERIANEAVRQDNELGRIIAEGNRVQAEAIREANEAERISNENTRIANENTRQSNEATRINNENIRQQQEQARQASMADIENRWATLTTAQQQDAEVIDARTSTIKNKTFPALNNRLEEIENDIVNPVYSDEVVIEGGIGSIPSNAAEGQISVVLKGFTNTNLVPYPKMDTDSNSDGIVDGFAAGTWSCSPSLSLDGGQKITMGGATVSNAYAEVQTSGYIPVAAGKTYTLSVEAKLVRSAAETVELVLTWYDANNTLIGNNGLYNQNPGTNYQRLSFTVTAPANAVKAKVHLRLRASSTSDTGSAWFKNVQLEPNPQASSFIVGTKSTISAMRIRSVSSDETQQSEIYIPNIGELRSLPNGVKDEFSLTTGKLIKRVSDWITLNGSENWEGFRTFNNTYRMEIKGWTVANNAYQHDASFPAIVLNDDGYYETLSFNPGIHDIRGIGTNKDNNRLLIRVEKEKIDAMPSGGTLAGFKEYLAQHPITLIYQLASPIITQYPPQSLIGYPNGTVYWEPVVKDIAIYNNGITIANPNIPIKTMQAVYKLDGQSKIEIPLANVTVAGDKLSFTITGAQNGEVYEYIYEYDTSLSTIPTIQLTANMNLKAVVSSTDKAVANLNKYVLELNDFTVAMLLNHEMRLTLLEVQ